MIVFLEEIPTPAVSEQRAQRRRLARLAGVCATVIAVALLAKYGPSDVRVAGASTGDGCGGWRPMVAELFPGEVDFACSVLLCESGGNPNAVSSARAMGLMQIHEPTWARPGHPDPVAHFIGVHWDRRFDGWSNLVFAQKIRHHYSWNQWVCAR